MGAMWKVIIAIFLLSVIGKCDSLRRILNREEIVAWRECFKTHMNSSLVSTNATECSVANYIFEVKMKNCMRLQDKRVRQIF